MIYYLAQPRYRNALLLVGSFVFYASGRVEHAALLSVCVLVNFWCALPDGETGEGQEVVVMGCTYL